MDRSSIHQEIYPSSFTNVRFRKKTEFSNVIFREKRSLIYTKMQLGSGVAVSSKKCLCWSPGGWGESRDKTLGKVCSFNET